MITINWIDSFSGERRRLRLQDRESKLEVEVLRGDAWVLDGVESPYQVAQALRLALHEAADRLPGLTTIDLVVLEAAS